MSLMRQRGITVVELMVTVAVIFIVSAVAVTSYREYRETAALSAMRQTIEAFRMFQDNYHIDNGTYLEGKYVPGGVNDFSGPLGYRIADDESRISLVVTACDGGAISDCYRVEASNPDGQKVVWNDGVFTTE